MFASVALTVKLAVPVWVGVPLNNPLRLIVNPAGNEPDSKVKLTVPVVLLAVSCWL